MGVWGAACVLGATCFHVVPPPNLPGVLPQWHGALSRAAGSPCAGVASVPGPGVPGAARARCAALRRGGRMEAGAEGLSGVVSTGLLLTLP